MQKLNNFKRAMKFFIFLNFMLITSCTCISNYHELAFDNKATLGNNISGLLVGIEKYNWCCINKEKGIDNSRYKLVSPETRSSSLFKEIATQQKAMIVSHILEFKKGVRSDLYNPFITDGEATPEYEEGYNQLDKLREKIKSEIKSKYYSHIILMSMGWHNDQFESISRYKKIITEIKDQDIKKQFNPYVVVITWPSSWGSNAKSIVEKMGHLASYPNKAEDADEVGLTVANYLLHNIILSAASDIKKDGSNIKTVAIGHSFGARLLSRAIFSKDFLKDDNTNGTRLDLFIGLQPAFSANRFIKDEGLEGSPYTDHSKLNTKILITGSKFDWYNNSAKWSQHLGGSDSFVIQLKNIKQLITSTMWIL